MIVHPIIFGTYTGRYTQAIPETLVILEESGYVIAFIDLVHDGGIITYMLISGSRSDLRTTVPFLVELIVEIVVRTFVSLRFRSVSCWVEHTGYPGDQITR